MLSALSEAGAEFLVVRAHALAAHRIARATSDLDIWVKPHKENAGRVMRALMAFGAPLMGSHTRRFDEDRHGLSNRRSAPSRVDILSGISGVGFDEARSRRIVLDIEGVIAGAQPRGLHHEQAGQRTARICSISGARRDTRFQTARLSLRPYGARLDRGARRTRSQPQEHRRRHPAAQAGGHHRSVRIGQVVARLRHDLRRRAAPVCRVAVRLRAPVPRADGEAGRRPDRRPVARHFHRAEDHRIEPAIDGRHGHRDLRLPAAALRQHRRPALPELRQGDHQPVARAHRRHGDAVSAGRAHQRAGADRPRPQGRVQEGARRAARRAATRRRASTASSARSRKTSSSIAAATTRSRSSSIA